MRRLARSNAFKRRSSHSPKSLRSRRHHLDHTKRRFVLRRVAEQPKPDKRGRLCVAGRDCNQPFVFALIVNHAEHSNRYVLLDQVGTIVSENTEDNESSLTAVRRYIDGLFFSDRSERKAKRLPRHLPCLRLIYPPELRQVGLAPFKSDGRVVLNLEREEFIRVPYGGVNFAVSRMEDVPVVKRLSGLRLHQEN